MLYLFNSGYWQNHINNLLNTLHFPKGVINVYQYKTDDPSYSISQNAINARVGTKVLINYIDRLSSPEFCYYPMRYGKLVKCEKNNTNIYFHIELCDYCNAQDINDFNNNFSSSFDNTLFKNKDNSVIMPVENQQTEGCLAFCENTYDLKIMNLLSSDHNSWKETVEQLSNCELFKNNFPIFTKVKILNAKDKEVSIKRKNLKNNFILRVGNTYNFKTTYYLPYINQNIKFKAYINTASNPDVFLKKEDSKLFGAATGDENFSCNISKEVKNCIVDIKYEAKIGDAKDDKNTQLLIANKPIPIITKSKCSKWWKVILFAVLFAISSFILSVQVDNIIEEVKILNTAGDPVPMQLNIFYQIARILDSFKYIYQVIFSIVSSLSLFFLVKIYGKD
ncbi:MAG: hypothetical protein FWF92_00455 [Oscillospiraceae bacterium]|nr:hypothetical protein [Oscillospiraceae bacterium]